MSDWVGAVDQSRAVLEMTGSDACAVLQGVVTNDVDRIDEDGAVYAALLTPQGKYLADFLLLAGADGAVLIDADAEQAPGLAKRLGMYTLRRDAKVIQRPDLAVGLIWPSGAPGTFPTVTGRVVDDPRDPALGRRIYGAGVDAVIASAGIAPGEMATYHALRIRLGVPVAGTDLLPNDSYILEAGFERLSGVDFRKGCYVGQEVTARMKHKTELRKGLVAVRLDGVAEPGTTIERAGKAVGTLHSVSGANALAHLRFDRAGPGMTAGAATVHYDAD